MSIVSELMEEMRAAIMAADIPALGRIAKAMEGAIDGIADLPSGELAHLRTEARQNARRLEAVLSGVRSGRRRFGDIVAAERSMTYDRSGTKTGMSSDQPGLRI